MNQSISIIRRIRVESSCDCTELGKIFFVEASTFKDLNSKLDLILKKYDQYDVDFAFLLSVYYDDTKHTYCCYDVKSLKILLAAYDTFYSMYRLIGKKKGK